MANNSSLAEGKTPMLRINNRVILVQVLVVLFLCVNVMLIVTFFMKEVFYTTMRYIFFAHTLLSDCFILFTTNQILIINILRYPVHVWACLAMVFSSAVFTYTTPLTLTAMTLERYVAICMPLRHATLCSARGALQVIVLIYVLSVFPTSLVLAWFVTSVTSEVKRDLTFCSSEVFFLRQWQSHLRSVLNKVYFLIMFVVIAFSYVCIARVARAASGENKKSTRKGLSTVLLHAIQLLLCLIQLFCPMVEDAILQNNSEHYPNFRYSNYILFMLMPRCLSPLVYGLRDEKFFLALRHYLLCGLVKNKS
ncbi:unnamed protein product [Ophioblennius macclurei]